LKPNRTLILAQVLAAAVALASVTWLVAGGIRSLAPPATEIPLAIALGAALLVLGFFNVWLPRGDAVDTTAAVVFAVGAILHPILGSLVVVLARCAISIFKSRGQTVWSFLEYSGRRVLLVSATFAVFGPGLLDRLQSGGIMSLALRVALTASAFMVLDTLLQQAHASARSRAPFLPMLVGTVRLQGWMIAAETSVAVLTVLLFQAIPNNWGLVVTVGLLLVMRQSFALLLEVRASYTSTVEVLARSIEAYDPDRRGHAERVARMVGEAGRTLGLQGKRLENLTYAALFHDVGLLGSDDPEDASTLRSSEVLSNVGFLAGAVPILNILDGVVSDDSSLDEDDLVGAYMVAHCSALDSEINVSGREGYDLANAVGARLYAATRRDVDRALSRVDLAARDGSLTLSNLVEVLP
jgi:hypothetical protein